MFTEQMCSPGLRTRNTRPVEGYEDVLQFTTFLFLTDICVCFLFQFDILDVIKMKGYIHR